MKYLKILNDIKVNKIKFGLYELSYNEFNVLLHTGSTSSLFLNFHSSEDIKSSLIQKISELYKNKCVLVVSTDFGIKIDIVDWSKKIVINIISNIIYESYKYLKDNNVDLTICPMGNENNTDSEIIYYKETYVRVSANNINTLQANTIDDNAPNRYFLGILGILSATILSIALWVLFNNYIGLPSITFAIAFFVGDYLYIKLGAKNNKKKFMLLSFSSIPLFFTVFITHYLNSSSLFESKNIIEPLIYLFTEGTLRVSLLIDLGVGITSIVIALLILIFDFCTKNKNSKINIIKKK